MTQHALLSQRCISCPRSAGESHSEVVLLRYDADRRSVAPLRRLLLRHDESAALSVGIPMHLAPHPNRRSCEHLKLALQRHCHCLIVLVSVTFLFVWPSMQPLCSYTSQIFE